MLPVPKTSLRDPLPPSGFRIQQVRKDVFVYDDGLYFATMIKYKHRLILVDFPNAAPSFNFNENYLFLNATRRILNGTVPTHIDMVYSHRHFHHIGQSGHVKEYFADKFPDAKLYVWGTFEVSEFILREKMSILPLPNMIIGPFGQAIHLSSELSVQMSIIGGHSSHDLLVHVPQSEGKNSFVHFVDFTTPGFVSYANFALSVGLGRFIGAQKDVLKLDFDIFNPGYGRVGNKNDIIRNIEYAKDVMRFAKEAQATRRPEKLIPFGSYSLILLWYTWNDK